MGRNGPIQVKFKYLTEPGRRVAKVDVGNRILFSIIFIFVILFIITSIKTNFFSNFSNGFTEMFPQLVIFIFIILAVVSSAGHSTNLALQLSTNTLFLEKKFFNWKYNNKELGNSKNIKLELEPYNIFLLGNKESENFFIIINDTSKQQKIPLFQNQYFITKSEAEKLAGFLNIKKQDAEQKKEEKTEINKLLKINEVSGYAIASIVLGGVALFMLFIGGVVGIIALIFGIIALKDINKNKKKGKAIATIGIVAGIISIGITIAFVSILLSTGEKIQISGLTNLCESQPGYVCTELECYEYSDFFIPISSLKCSSNKNCCAPVYSNN